MGQLSELSVSNVFIYVADAVRWDTTPDSIAERGVTAKTVASSIHTPSSFPSIATGLHPPQHGCWDFSYRLDDDTTTMFDLPGYSTGFANSVNEKFHTDPDMEFVLDKVLNTSLSSFKHLEDIDTPFLFLERGPGGHSPYGDFDGNGLRYYRDRGAAPTTQYVEEYREGVDIDADHFESQLEVLEERGLLDDTLVVYTSDHGELLGEGGCLGHNEPIHPIHTYVPTVFIHSDLEPERSGDLFRHVDLFPTVCGALNEDLSGFPGRDLTTDEPAERGACYYTRDVATGLPVVSGQLEYESVWDRNGGYVFPQNGRLNRSVVLLGKLLRGTKREYMLRHLPEVALHYLTNDTVYGVPSFDDEAAAKYLEEIESFEKSTTVRTELDDSEKDHLRQLGYIT